MMGVGYQKKTRGVPAAARGAWRLGAKAGGREEGEEGEEEGEREEGMSLRLFRRCEEFYDIETRDCVQGWQEVLGEPGLCSGRFAKLKKQRKSQGLLELMHPACSYHIIVCGEHQGRRR
eukprot:754339-Hanusia_phi.AAC.3